MTGPRIALGPEDLAPRETVLAMSGLDFMRAVLAGELPMAPIAGPMNLALTAVEPGLVRVRGTPRFDHCNPFGAVHGGWYGTLLDTALGCAVMTEVPQGSWYTTLEYKVNLTRAIPPGTEVEAEARIRHAGRSTAVAEADVRDPATGRLHATGSTTCIILRG